MQDSNKKEYDEMRDEYDFDFSNSKPNPYAKKIREQENLVKLDKDVAKYYKTSQQVNDALRSIISKSPNSSPAI